MKKNTLNTMWEGVVSKQYKIPLYDNSSLNEGHEVLTVTKDSVITLSQYESVKIMANKDQTLTISIHVEVPVKEDKSQLKLEL